MRIPPRTLPSVTRAWHEGELEVQQRAGIVDQEKLRLGVRDALPPHFCEFLSVQRFIVVATCDDCGVLWCSMVAGWPGFARAEDPGTVSIHSRAFQDGDILAHLTANPRVGILAIDPSTRRRIRVNGTATVGAGTVTIQVAETFGNCRQYVQQRPASGPEPQKPSIVATGDALNEREREWIATADTLFIATMHSVGGPDASHRGGRPGFVTVSDERTVEFSDYPGNDMFQTLGNITAEGTAAMLFVDFNSGATLQLTGNAVVLWERPGSPTGRALQFTVTRVVEKRLEAPWHWPVVQYSPVNP